MEMENEGNAKKLLVMKDAESEFLNLLTLRGKFAKNTDLDSNVRDKIDKREKTLLWICVYGYQGSTVTNRDNFTK